MTEATPAVPKAVSKRLEPTLLGLSGALLLALSAYFLWSELALPSAVLAVAGSALAAAGAWLAHRKGIHAVGPMMLSLAGLVSGAWYAATREPVLLWGLAVSFVASLAMTLASQRRFRELAAKVHRKLWWLTTAATGLAATFAFYFFVFDASDNSLQGFVARRALLTLGWLVSGTAMVVFGSKREAAEIRDAGYLVLGTSLVKMLFYDVGQDAGPVRIVALAIGGLVLLGASRLAHLFRKEAA